MPPRYRRNFLLHGSPNDFSIRSSKSSYERQLPLANRYQTLCGSRRARRSKSSEIPFTRTLAERYRRIQVLVGPRDSVKRNSEANFETRAARYPTILSARISYIVEIRVGQSFPTTQFPHSSRASPADSYTQTGVSLLVSFPTPLRDAMEKARKVMGGGSEEQGDVVPILFPISSATFKIIFLRRLSLGALAGKQRNKLPNCPINHLLRPLDQK